MAIKNICIKYKKMVFSKLYTIFKETTIFEKTQYRFFHDFFIIKKLYQNLALLISTELLTSFLKPTELTRIDQVFIIKLKFIF